MIYSDYLLSLWDSGALVTEISHISTVHLSDWPSIKSLDSKFKELPWLATLCLSCHTWLLENLSTSCWLQLGEASFNFVPCFLHTSPRAFSLLWFYLVTFAVLNHNHEWNSFWVLWVHPENYPDWWWFWRSLTWVYALFCIHNVYNHHEFIVHLNVVIILIKSFIILSLFLSNFISSLNAWFLW